MIDTLTGFAVVGVAIALGYVIGRIDLLGPHARHVLGRLIFFVLSPFLLFSVLAHADAGMLFSSLLPVSAIAAVAVIVVYVLFARLWWKRPIGETVIGGVVDTNDRHPPMLSRPTAPARTPPPRCNLREKRGA